MSHRTTQDAPHPPPQPDGWVAWTRTAPPPPPPFAHALQRTALIHHFRGPANNTRARELAPNEPLYVRAAACALVREPMRWEFSL